MTRITDIGPPHSEKFLHPHIKRNYGHWLYHETLAPGVLCHVAESGERIYTVRAGSPRLLSVSTIRRFASLADQYSGGYLRFTSRHNLPRAGRSAGQTDQSPCRCAAGHTRSRCIW